MSFLCPAFLTCWLWLVLESLFFGLYLFEVINVFFTWISISLLPFGNLFSTISVNCFQLAPVEFFLKLLTSISMPSSRPESYFFLFLIDCYMFPVHDGYIYHGPCTPYILILLFHPKAATFASSNTQELLHTLFSVSYSHSLSLSECSSTSALCTSPICFSSDWSCLSLPIS